MHFQKNELKPKPYILLFNGPPGSGKDAACSFLKENLGYVHFEFKMQLFKETCKYYGVSIDWFLENYTRETKDSVSWKVLDNKTMRESLIHVSEDIIKPRYGLEYFGKKVSDEIALISGKNICISDCGFTEEIETVINNHKKAYEIQLIRMYRNKYSFSGDSRRYIKTTHDKSDEDYTKHLYHERPIDIQCHDFYNEGTLADLYTSLIKIL